MHSIIWHDFMLSSYRIKQKSWAGELRQVTILFINLGIKASSLNTVTPQSLNELQIIVRHLQAIIYSYQGSLNKFLIDDKGKSTP